MSAAGSASRSTEQTFMTATTSLPLSPLASPAVIPIPETPKLEPQSKDGFISDRSLTNDDDTLEVRCEKPFSFTIQRIREFKDSLSRPPDTRTFTPPEFIYGIDSLFEKMNLEWCGPRGYAVSIRGRFYADKEKLKPNKVKFSCN